MRINEKGFSVLSGTLGLAGAGLILAGGLVYNAGAVRISVRENRPGGDSVRLVLPAAVIPVVMAFVPDENLRQVPQEALGVLPALKIAAEELKNLPDCTLVEVHGPDEEITISLRDGTLAVDVVSDEEEVHLQIPLVAVESVASSLVSANES